MVEVVVPKIFYKQGIIEVTRPWTRPNIELFNYWLDDFLKIDGIDDYDVWLSGGFFHKLPTWDIDITLTGTPTEYGILSNIMITGTRLGFDKYNMLFDIQHCSVIPGFYPERRTVKKLLFYDRIIKNDEMVVDYTYGKRVHENLWEVESIMPNDKQQEKINSGYVYPKQQSVRLN